VRFFSQTSAETTLSEIDSDVISVVFVLFFVQLLSHFAPNSLSPLRPLAVHQRKKKKKIFFFCGFVDAVREQRIESNSKCHMSKCASFFISCRFDNACFVMTTPFFFFNVFFSRAIFFFFFFAGVFCFRLFVVNNLNRKNLVSSFSFLFELFSSQLCKTETIR
jgi:hypothetical protein